MTHDTATDTTEPGTEQRPTEDQAAEKPRSVTIAIRLPRSATLLRTVTLLVLVAALAAATWQWRRADDFAAREATRRQITTIAGQFGSALLSYDHADLDSARKRVVALTTDEFGKSYEQAFSTGLQGAITKLNADATATVRAVYLTQVHGAAAKAVVVMDSQVNSSAGVRKVTGSYLEMDLVRQGGTWKVSAVNSIGAINESLTPTPSPTASPSP